MTTLHEEPSSRQTLTEEVEENYSDSELTQYLDDAAVKPPIRSKFPTSKTMGSLRDIGNNFQAMNNVRNHSNVTAKNFRKNVINKQTSGTSSLTSSTSSGYGSQVKKRFLPSTFLSPVFNQFHISLSLFLFFLRGICRLYPTVI